MENNITRLYYSHKQTKDGTLANLYRQIGHSRLTARILAGLGIEYATITNGLGIYKGGTEPSHQIFILGIDKEKAVSLARAIREKFNQDSILLDFNGQISFITA